MKMKIRRNIMMLTGAAVVCSFGYFFFNTNAGNFFEKKSENGSFTLKKQYDASTLHFYDEKRIATYSEQKLLGDFDIYIDRLIAGDDISGPERMDMIWRLEAAVQLSPKLRAALKRRVEKAIESDEYMALIELEQAFDTSEIGAQALLDAYSKTIKTGGKLDWHAMQSASYMYGGLTDPQKTDYFNGAFSQLAKYDDFERANGAMKFLANAAGANQKIPDGTRSQASELMKARLFQARTEDDQFYTAKYLYKMYNPSDASRLAEAVLRQRQTYPIARATLDAIVNGRMSSNPALIELLIGVASRPGISNSERTYLTNLLASATAAGKPSG
jgi:hypothetical protein